MKRLSTKSDSTIASIAFLRGINVGGHKIIRMQELKRIFVSLGFNDVQTFIQSGNVLFTSSEKDFAKLEARLTKGLRAALGYDVAVLVRSIKALETLVKANPPGRVKLDADTRAYVSFLSDTPGKEKSALLTAMNDDRETFQINDREAFIVCYKHEPGKLRFSNTFLEKKLGVVATTRNWVTLRKMLAFAKANNFLS